MGTLSALDDISKKHRCNIHVRKVCVSSEIKYFADAPEMLSAAFGRYRKELLFAGCSFGHISGKKRFYMICIRYTVILIAFGMLRTAGNPQLFGRRLGLVELVNHRERYIGVGTPVNKKHRFMALGKLADGRSLTECPPVT